MLLFRLLKAMGFIDDDITVLQNLWDLEEEKNEEETDSFISLPSSSDEYLSSDGLYLKSFLSKPLACALREIVAKKPFNPIEYLGHWLLNYKVKYNPSEQVSFIVHLLRIHFLAFPNTLFNLLLDYGP